MDADPRRRQLLTLQGPTGPRRGPALSELHIIENGAVLIHNGIIHQLGPGNRVENLAESRQAQEIDVRGRIVLPAFAIPAQCSLLLRAPPGA